MKRLPAIPTVYRGIRFRSKLEAKYARAFDILRISWTYEEVNFMFDDGTCYAPDFYMPEIDTYFEVKGVMTEEDERKIKMLSEQGNTVVVGHPDGAMTLYEGKAEYDIGGPGGSESLAVKCDKCGAWFFTDDYEWWKCKFCGAYEGNGHLSGWKPNLFDLAYKG